MEDEEEVIMALVDSLPRVAACIGGTEHSPVVLESMEMLFMVDNDTIVKKVKEAVKVIYDSNKQVLKPKLIEVIDNFWKTEEITARDMCLYFYGMMLDDLTDEEKSIIIKNFCSKFKKEPVSLRMGILEALSNLKSAPGIKLSNFMKALGDDVKSNVGNNNYMNSVKTLLIELLKADDQELNSKIFAIIREVDKGNVRPFFKPSVILPTWNTIKNKSEEDADLYDQDLVWKKLVDLQVDKDQDNLDPKESRIRKELDIFDTLLSAIDIDKLDYGFFTSLENILLKDEFFTNLYLQYYWKLEKLATEESEKSLKLKSFMEDMTFEKIKEKTETLEKISSGLKKVLKEYKTSNLVANQEEFLDQLIGLNLKVENWRDRMEVADIILDLAKNNKPLIPVLKKNYLKLILDPSFETRNHAVDHFIDILNLEDKKGSVDSDYASLLDSALSQKSCFRRCVGITLVEVGVYQSDNISIA